MDSPELGQRSIGPLSPATQRRRGCEEQDERWANQDGLGGKPRNRKMTHQQLGETYCQVSQWLDIAALYWTELLGKVSDGSFQSDQGL